MRYVGMLQDQDLDVWLHQIQPVTWYGHPGTWANMDSGYWPESTTSTQGFWGSEEEV